MTVPGYGFLLNNELTVTADLADFNFTPVAAGVPDPNLPGASKRPRSSMAPTIVLDHGKPGHNLKSVPEIGAATAVRLFGNRLLEAAAETTRRGSGSAQVVNPTDLESGPREFGEFGDTLHGTGQVGLFWSWSLVRHRTVTSVGGPERCCPCMRWRRPCPALRSPFDE